MAPSQQAPLNPAKSNYLIVAPKMHPIPSQICLTLNDTEIPHSNNVKFLGVRIDPQLNFQAHIRATEQRISRSIGIISKLKYFLLNSALLKLYYAFIYPHLLNGLVVWGSTYPTYLKNLSVIQNKAVRLLKGGAYRDHITPFYSALKTVKLSDIFKHEVAKTVFRHLRNNLPPLISHLFTKTSEISSRNTRLSNDPSTTLYIPRYHTARLQRCIKYQGVKIWNNIPTEIKNKSFNYFKRHYKNYLLNQH